MNRRTLLMTLPLATGMAGTARAGGGGRGPRGGASDGPRFIALGTTTANGPMRNGRPLILSAEVGLDVADPALRIQVQASAPRIRARHAEVMNRLARGTPAFQAPDVEALADALQTATDAALGKPGARVLLGTVMLG